MTGANIYNIATADWKIKGIKCEYVYNFKYKEDRKKTRRDFAPGEFEQIYKSFPKIELIFKKEFSHLDHRALLAIIDRINEELPTANCKLRKIEKAVDATATLTAETKEAVEEIAKILPVQYANLLDELKKEIKRLSDHKNSELLSSLPVLLASVKGITGQSSGNLANPPTTIIIMNQPRDFNMPAAPTYGPVQIGPVTIQNLTQNINNLLDHFASSNFDDDAVRKASQEFQPHYDNLDEQGKKDLENNAEQIINKKVKDDPSFKEKLINFGKRIAKHRATKEGIHFGKEFLYHFIAVLATKPFH